MSTIILSSLSYLAWICCQGHQGVFCRWFPTLTCHCNGRSFWSNVRPLFSLQRSHEESLEDGERIGSGFRRAAVVKKAYCRLKLRVRTQAGPSPVPSWRSHTPQVHTWRDGSTAVSPRLNRLSTVNKQQSNTYCLNLFVLPTGPVGAKPPGTTGAHPHRLRHNEPRRRAQASGSSGGQLSQKHSDRE